MDQSIIVHFQFFTLELPLMLQIQCLLEDAQFFLLKNFCFSSFEDGNSSSQRIPCFFSPEDENSSFLKTPIILNMKAIQNDTLIIQNWLNQRSHIQTLANIQKALKRSLNWYICATYSLAKMVGFYRRNVSWSLICKRS